MSNSNFTSKIATVGWGGASSAPTDLTVVGIDLGGSHVSAAVVNRSGEVLGRAEKAIDRGKDAEHLLTEDVADAVHDAMHAAGVSDIGAVGMGLPGNIDRAAGICRFSPNFHWRDVPVAAPLSNALGRPVHLLNDVRSHTLGELHFGAGRGLTSFVMIALGTGIGGGLVLNGRLHEGAHSGGGEIGHITVEPDGPPCNCGNHGCIEALAAAPAITKLARQAAERGEAPALLAIAQTVNAITPATLTQAARQGDAVALALWERIGRSLGIAIAAIQTTVDPEKVLIGGGVAKAGEFLLGPARAEAERRCRMVAPQNIRIELAALGEDAGMVGAAALALESLGLVPPALP